MGRLQEAMARQGVATPNPVKVVATIRTDSKYAYQKVYQPEPFEVQLKPDLGGYVVIGGFGGCYRLQDVILQADTGFGLVELNFDVRLEDE